MIMVGGATSAAAGSESGVLKSLSDKARERVYVLVHDGVKVLEPGTRRELAHLALPGWIWAGDAYSCPPDIALAPEGDVLVASNVMPAIWRIERRTFTVTMHELAASRYLRRNHGNRY